jgi:hypothetical protein
MARRGWRYLATRLNGDGTETLLDPDLPLEEVTIDDVLSGDSGISGKIDPVYTRLLGPDGLPIMREWGTAIYAENNGAIRAGGIVQHSGFNGPEWTVESVGFTGYGRDLPYTGSGYKGIKVDPIDVARIIWGYIQAQPGGNIGLTFDQVKSGQTIGTELQQVQFDTQSGPVSFEAGPYKLNWYTNHDLQGDFDDLAKNTPFDYHERHFWQADGTVGHHVDIGYPKIGRRRNDLFFSWGVNVFEVPTVERDGTQYASGTLVLGAGDGAAMIKSLRETPTRPTGRLRRIAVVIDDTIKSITAASRRADIENQWRARLDDISSIIVRDHPSAPLGAAQVGDEIHLSGRGDWVNTDMWVRVLAISYQPANGNVAEYTVARTDKLTQ